MKPLDLLDVATALIGNNRGRPSTTFSRRAVSSTYYAMFHCLARDCADLLIGSAGADRSMDAWLQVYRSLEHGTAKDRCKRKEMLRRFPKQIEDFATAFVILQEKRHRADYDPLATFIKSEVEADIALVRQTMLDYRTVPMKHRRAFCAYILLKQRPDEAATGQAGRAR